MESTFSQCGLLTTVNSLNGPSLTLRELKLHLIKTSIKARNITNDTIGGTVRFMKVLLKLIRLVYTEKMIDFAKALHESLLAYQVAPS